MPTFINTRDAIEQSVDLRATTIGYSSKKVRQALFVI